MAKSVLGIGPSLALELGRTKINERRKGMSEK